jgi:hypothetical protein
MNPLVDKGYYRLDRVLWRDAWSSNRGPAVPEWLPVSIRIVGNQRCHPQSGQLLSEAESEAAGLSLKADRRRTSTEVLPFLFASDHFGLVLRLGAQPEKRLLS